MFNYRKILSYIPPDKDLRQTYVTITICVTWVIALGILFFSGRPNLSTNILFFFFFYAILALSLNLTSGLMGVVNFGIVAQVFCSAVPISVLLASGVDIITSFIVGIICSIAYSTFISMTSLKLRDDYFAIVSITVGEILRQILATDPFLRTGSSEGIINIPNILNEWTGEAPDFLGIPVYTLVFSLLASGLLVLSFFLIQKLAKSPYGRMLKSIREDEDVAKIYGKNTFFVKIITFAASGLLTGFAGLILVLQFGAVFPINFLPTITFFTWIILIVGGRGNNKGMLVGTIIFVTLWRILAVFNEGGTIADGVTGVVNFLNPHRTTFFGAATDSIAFANLELITVGLLLMLVIIIYPRGAVNELPFKPDNPEAKKSKLNATENETE